MSRSFCIHSYNGKWLEDDGVCHLPNKQVKNIVAITGNKIYGNFVDSVALINPNDDLVGSMPISPKNILDWMQMYPNHKEKKIPEEKSPLEWETTYLFRNRKINALNKKFG